MQPLILADAIPDIARVLNKCEDSLEIIEYINRAQRRLLNKGRWVGSWGRFRICVNANCITLPRQILNVESIAISGVPTQIANQWYEWLPGGPGILAFNSSTDANCVGRMLTDRGTTVCHTDIVGTDKKIRVVADVAEAVGAKITLQGWDENGIWIRTVVGSSYINGEQVTISTTPTVSTKFFSSLTGVIKPTTNGTVRLYSQAPDTTLVAIAEFEYDETRPQYRRYLISGLCPGTDCEDTTVDLMARLRFIPAREDNDWLMLTNLDAIVLAVQALAKEGRNLWDEAAKYWASAVQCLQDELKTYQGSGASVVVKMQNAEVWGSSGIPNLQ